MRYLPHSRLAPRAAMGVSNLLLASGEMTMSLVCMAESPRAVQPGLRGGSEVESQPELNGSPGAADCFKMTR